MGDIFAPLSGQSIWLDVFVLAAFYVALTAGLVRFLRPVTFGMLDPMNVQIVLFTAPAIMGVLMLPFVTGAFSSSYLLIVAFMAVWLIIIRLCGRAVKIDLSDEMGTDFQFSLLSLCFLITVLNVWINMVLPGKIPLFSEGGVYTRFEAGQNSRLLSWLSLGTGPMAGLIFALTQHRKVRRAAAGVVGFQIVAALLGASKGAILSILFVLLNAMFVARVRMDSTREHAIRKLFVPSAALVAGITPVYLAVIGFASDGGALLALGLRFLGGFDQLIYASQFDLLNVRSFGSLLHMTLVEYQFMPFFKSVFSAKYLYSSVGQYVISQISGIYVEGPATFPNSNLILETIFTSGTILGLIAFIVELACFYICRIYLFRRPVRRFSLVLLAGVVFNPFGLFLSGQEWFTEILVMFLTVAAAGVIEVLWRAIRTLLALSFPLQPKTSDL